MLLSIPQGPLLSWIYIYSAVVAALIVLQSRGFCFKQISHYCSIHLIIIYLFLHNTIIKT